MAERDPATGRFVSAGVVRNPPDRYGRRDKGVPIDGPPGEEWWRFKPELPDDDDEYDDDEYDVAVDDDYLDDIFDDKRARDGAHNCGPNNYHHCPHNDNRWTVHLIHNHECIITDVTADKHYKLVDCGAGEHAYYPFIDEYFKQFRAGEVAPDRVEGCSKCSVSDEPSESPMERAYRLAKEAGVDISPHWKMEFSDGHKCTVSANRIHQCNTGVKHFWHIHHEEQDGPKRKFTIFGESKQAVFRLSCDLHRESRDGR